MTVRKPVPDDEILLADYDFDLPAERIAREPARPRDTSRLLIVDRSTRRKTDGSFQYLADHLAPGDLLVLNNTRVLAARVLGTLQRTGRGVEVLFVHPLPGGAWAAMLRPGRRVRDGDRVAVAGPDAEAGPHVRIGSRGARGLRTVRLEPPADVYTMLDRCGHVPLPPYIDRPDLPADRDDYQTVYASVPGAVAAPTAGLHLTRRVLARLRRRGVEIAELTLHVGAGTFTPVRIPNARDHRLHAERFEIPPATADALNRARDENRRIVAVGTTTTRTLEHVVGRHGRFVAGGGETDLYILPGHRFRAVGGLLTNFHLPRSTLMLLVSAFAGRGLVLEAYAHAIARGYRFYSYGDATLFL